MATPPGIRAALRNGMAVANAIAVANPTSRNDTSHGSRLVCAQAGQSMVTAQMDDGTRSITVGAMLAEQCEQVTGMPDSLCPPSRAAKR